MALFNNESDSMAEEFGARWNRFWFSPADVLPCCVLRIVVGLLATTFFFNLTFQLSQWYAKDGVLPPAAVVSLFQLTNANDVNYHHSYLGFFNAGTELRIVHWAAIAVAVAFTVGLFTRISGVLTLVALLAYVHRAPQVAGHLEPVLCFLIPYLCIAPSGALLSLDRTLFGAAKKGSLGSLLMGPSEPSVAANIGLRLIQIHVAIFYAMVGLTKLYGDAWWEGNAIWMLLAQTQSRPLDLTGMRRLGPIGEYLLNFWTHAVVYFELAFPILIWTRMFRPLVLAMSVVVWLSIILASGQLLFGLAMLATGIAFLPPAYLRAIAGQSTSAVATPATVVAA